MLLSIIIPCHKALDISEMVQSVRLFHSTAEIIVIEDDEGKGKGWAIRHGILSATGDILVFIDADIDIHPAEILKLLPYIRYYDVVIGVKDIKNLPLKRKIVSFGYRLLVRLLFRLRITDSQTGLKIWKARNVPISNIDGFAFDIDMLVKARRANLRIKEVPIKCRVFSAVKLTSIIQTFKETIKIWLSR